jgi:hypothetical protein
MILNLYKIFLSVTLSRRALRAYGQASEESPALAMGAPAAGRGFFTPCHRHAFGDGVQNDNEVSKSLFVFI